MKFWWNLDWRKYRIGNVCLCIENRDYYCQCTWMTSKLAGKKQNLAPMWKKLMKNVDLDERTSFLDHVYLGCTQRECKPNELIINWRTEKWSNHEFLLEHRKNTRRACSKMLWEILRTGKQDSGAVIQSFKSLLGWPSIQTGRTWISWRIITSLLTNCIEMLVLGTNRKTRHSVVCQQTCKSSHKMDSGMRQTIGKIDFIHSSHKWLPDNIVTWETLTQHCRLGLFQDSDFAGDLEDSKSTSGESCVCSEVEHLSPSVGCARSKHQSPTVQQNKKLFLWMLGLRLDGITALDLWDLIGLVLGNTTQNHKRPGRPVVNTGETRLWSNVKFAQNLTLFKKPKQPALDLWDVVIEVLRSTNSAKTPTHRASGNRCETGNHSRNTPKPKQKGNRDVEQLSHVWPHSHTHILLNASLSCTSLETKKQWSKWSSKAEVQRWDTCQERSELRLIGYLIESIWTPRSKSNMLTPKSNSPTCWPKVVLHVMNGIIFFDCWTSWICQCFPAAIEVQNRKQSVMSKRAQESTSKEGSAVAKPRPTNLVSWYLLSAKKTPPQDWSASNSPGNQELDQSNVSSSVRQLMRNNNQDPTAYSQERRQNDTLSSSTRELVRSGESASSASTRILERAEEIQIAMTRLDFHNVHISDQRYIEKVSTSRQKLNLAEEAPVLDLKTNVLIWGLCMSTTMKAAVHVGPNYTENLKENRNTYFEELKNLFHVTWRLVLDRQEDGVPKAGPKQAAAATRGSRTCVCASTLLRSGTRSVRRANQDVLP